MGTSHLAYMIQNAEIGNDPVEEATVEEREERAPSIIDVLHLDIPDNNVILPGRVYRLPDSTFYHQALERDEFSSSPTVNEVRSRRSGMRWVLSQLNPFKKR